MSTTDCASFERWLDEGADAAFETSMRAHADSCGRCALAWAAMAEIDAWWSAPIATPAGFADAVMARIEHPTPVPGAAVVEDMPWWVAIIQQPAVVLAAGAAALVLWRGGMLVSLASAAATWSIGITESAGATALAWTASLGGASLGGASLATRSAFGGQSTLVTVGLAVGLAPVVALASIALSGWVTRWVARKVLAA